MKEIGGYLQLDELIKRPFHRKCMELNSGRAALLYLSIYRNIKILYMPFYLCNSIFDYINNRTIEVRFYHINEKFHPIIDSIDENATIYIVNYYGFLSNELIEKFKIKYNNIIIDNTHAFFLKPLKDIDTIYSCRKFFGVPDGAYLYSHEIHKKELEKNKISNRLSHIIGREEYSATDFYQDYIKNDELFDSEPIKLMSSFSKKILGAIDYDLVENKRNENFIYLHDFLGEINLLNAQLINTIKSGQFCYPLLSKKSEIIRKKLISHKVYIPKLWPNVTTNYGASHLESNFANHILPIPCDQRYDKFDMDAIINIIRDEIYI
ncbi:hypothetical protein [Proteus mirabilis]|uniref:hypothetical protein n=1 Tax=Proteus mirabilis TaxID=584 RepID=UPI0007DBFD92|nr:hypothetical protein [Proteus mirabilis]MCU9564831.1 hypothetical protein [Proteus mirabilis]MDM3695997.1 hypothetical protein [Proteus mirabilis]OAS31809.1 hypothetical protein A6V31_03600 [Proteus mirabilis]OAS33289.1 hypothetical protein A6V32_03825 [Proteus mirabilis]